MIKENNRINFNELFRLVVRKTDGIAKTTLRKMVNDLKEQGKVYELEGSGKQVHLLTADMKRIRFEMRNLSLFDEELQKHEKRLERLDKIIGKLDPRDAILMFSRFVRMGWSLDLLFFESHDLYHEKEFQELFRRYENLKRQFFEMVYKVSSHKKGMMDEFNDDVRHYAKNAEIDFDNDLEDF